MKALAIILLTTSLVSNAFSQDYILIDSLNKILSQTKEDTVKGLVILQLTYEYVYSKPDSGLYYSDMGLSLTKDPSVKSKFAKSENFNLKSFEVKMYSLSAIALSQIRNDSLAVKTGLKALGLAEIMHDNNNLWATYSELGEVYQNIGEPLLALNYNRAALKINTDKNARQTIEVAIGTCFYDLKQYDSALYYLHKVDTAVRVTLTKPWPYPQTYLGFTYTKKGEYANAIPYYLTAIRFAEISKYNFDLAQACLGIAHAYKGLGKIDIARDYAIRSLQVATQFSFLSQSLEASVFLSEFYESKGAIDSAFKYQKISNAIEDNLFSTEKTRQVQNYIFTEKMRQKDLDDEKAAYRNKIRFYLLFAGLILTLVLAIFLIRNNKQKQKANLLLQQQKQKVESTLSELKSAQAQLIQSEKMASLGELTAGIAHEIQNPLNFVNNFSDVNKELLEEMKEEMDKGNLADAKAIANDVIDNEQKINQHGKRADSIVKGMLQHSKKSEGFKEPVDINKLCDEYLRLSYHGLRAKDKNFNATLRTDFDESVSIINIIPQDMGRVLLNLFNNAFYAVNERLRQAEPDKHYEPMVSVETKKNSDSVDITVRDNGNGIPQEIKDKIFQPFFTTKPTGSGTGLGLSLAYDIVKAYGGEIKVDSKTSDETEFIIQLPITHLI